MRDAYTADLAPIELMSQPGARIARAQCRQCGGHDEWRITGIVPPPDAIRRHFSTRGWWIKRKAICPQCSKPKEKSVKQNEITHVRNVAVPGSRVEVIAPEVIAVQRSDAAKKAKRLVYMALEDYYDDANRRYRGDHTDASVAKECDCAEDFVRSIREADFGPLAEPDEVAALRTELIGAHEALDAAALRVADIQKRFEGLCLKRGWAA